MRGRFQKSWVPMGERTIESEINNARSADLIHHAKAVNSDVIHFFFVSLLDLCSYFFLRSLALLAIESPPRTGSFCGCGGVSFLCSMLLIFFLESTVFGFFSDFLPLLTSSSLPPRNMARRTSSNRTTTSAACRSG